MHLRHRLSGREAVAFLQDVLEPELEWIHTQGVGDDVHLGLMRPNYLCDAITPECRRGRGVGIDPVRIHVEIGHPIGPPSSVSARNQIRRRIAIGAGVVITTSLHCDQRAVALDPGLELDLAFVLHAKEKNFIAPRDNFYRPSGFLRQQSRHRLKLAIELAAEAASKGKNNDAHIRQWYLENPGELPLDHVRILTAGPNGDLPVAHLRYGYVRLQRDVIHRRRTERVVEDLIRFPKAPSDISPALFEQMDDVGSGQRSGRHVRPARYDASRAFM